MLFLFVSAVKVPLDAYMMDFVFSELEDGGIFDNKNGMDYHIPVTGGIIKEPPLHIVHIAVEMAPIAKVFHSELIYYYYFSMKNKIFLLENMKEYIRTYKKLAQQKELKEGRVFQSKIRSSR